MWVRVPPSPPIESNIVEVLDEPSEDGLYVIYINDDYVTKYALRKLMLRFNNRWCYPGSDQYYRGHVYGCIGPLPILKFED